MEISPNRCAGIVIGGGSRLWKIRRPHRDNSLRSRRLRRARVFLGEIPRAEQHNPTPNFATRRELPSYLNRQHGLRTWFVIAHRFAYHSSQGDPLFSTAERKFLFGLPLMSSFRWLGRSICIWFDVGSAGSTRLGATICSENP